MKYWLMASALCLLPLAHADEAWNYENAASWGEKVEAHKSCAIGKNQSPINIVSKDQIEADLPALKVNYQAGGTDIINNGHTIQVNYTPGSTFSLDTQGEAHELKQIHFHAPSENQIDGKSYPLEGHLVHADKDGNLAVIAFMFDEGAPNPALAQFWDEMPAKPIKTPLGLKTTVDLAKLFPDNLDYYHYSGSLTTPPCSEGVKWFVIKQPLTASKEQIAKFTSTLGHPNNRPIQPVNARVILK